ncbi:MAG TPA: 4Fe-4S dicluster domain-containing protein, partial [Limnochordales bacterium]
AVVHRYGAIYTRCIECYSCLDSCPASPHDQAAFCGPMWMLQIARAHEHPLDGVDRLRQAWEQGLALCVNCAECQNACPVGLSPVAVIDELRMQSMRRRWRWWRRGAAAASTAGAARH